MEVVGEGGRRGGRGLAEEFGDVADEVAAGEGVASDVGWEGWGVDGDGEGAAIGGFGDDSGGVFSGEVAAVEVAEEAVVVVVAPHRLLLCSLVSVGAIDIQS